MNVLFSNIEKILEFSASLLEKLEKSGADPLTISQCFINSYQEFDVYTTYWWVDNLIKECEHSFPQNAAIFNKMLQNVRGNVIKIVIKSWMRIG